MNERVALAKLVSVMLGSALSAAVLVGLPLSAAVLVGLPSGVASGDVVGVVMFTSVIAVVAAVLGAFLGFPAILVVDKVFPDSRLRHIFLAPFCAVFAWLVIEGGFARGGWDQIWASSFFWTEWAPRRMAAVVVIGLLAGTFYTVIWPRMRRILKADQSKQHG